MMPNWCDCELEITGPKDQQDTFIKRLAQEQYEDDTWPGFITMLYPCPQELYEITAPTEIVPTKKEADRKNNEYGVSPAGLRVGTRKYLSKAEADFLDSKYGAHNWYQWQNKHWGVKWGDCRTEVTVEEDKIFITFETPWGPPSGALFVISQLFPGLLFNLRYWECGMGFAGEDEYQNGNLTEIEYTEDYGGSRGG